VFGGGAPLLQRGPDEVGRSFPAFLNAAGLQIAVLLQQPPPKPHQRQCRQQRQRQKNRQKLARRLEQSAETLKPIHRWWRAGYHHFGRK
jgi:hypothetical protein